MTMTQEYRAQHARELLDDEMLNEAFDALEKGCIEQLLQTRASDDRLRFDLTEKVKVIRAVKELLASEITKAKAAARQTIRVV